MQQAIDALSEPRRRAILEIVQNRECAVGEITAHFDVSQPAISQHLKVLRKSDLVVERRDGRRRLYRARPDGLRELYDYLEKFWIGHPASLKGAVEREYSAGQS
jgi:DNA-binding transcriptional ArsR family regulator